MNKLDAQRSDALIDNLRTRFEEKMARHAHIVWKEVEPQLRSNPGKLWTLGQMDETGGEPDVVSIDKKCEEIVFYDCARESPAGRRSLCYDRKALDLR